MLAESVSVYQVLNVVNDGFSKRKCLMEKYFIKRTQNTLHVKDLISSSGVKKLCAYFYHAPSILLWGTKYCARKHFCSNTLEGMD